MSTCGMHERLFGQGGNAVDEHSAGVVYGACGSSGFYVQYSQRTIENWHIVGSGLIMSGGSIEQDERE